MSAKIGSLNVDVTLGTARFKQGARELSAETKKLEGRFGGLKAAGAGLAGGLAGLGAGLVIGGLQDAISGAFELGSSLLEASQRAGLTVEALQRLRTAARDFGVSNEQLEQIGVAFKESKSDPAKRTRDRQERVSVGGQRPLPG